MPPTNRVEHDSMGALEVPVNALWGAQRSAQTQRAVQDFPGTGLRMPRGALTEGGVHGAGSAA
jgi:fumarate hydratase, class II